MHVIVVVGKPSNEDSRKDRFEIAATNTILNLRIDFDMARKDDLSYVWGPASRVQKRLEAIFLEKRDEDICLFYFGHGAEYGWAMLGDRRPGSVLAYEDLRLTLAQHSGNLLFINAPCYAGAASDALEGHGGAHCLIALVPRDKCGYPENFIHSIFGSWRARRFFNPRDPCFGNVEDNAPVVEGDIELQQLMFPKKEAFV
ncbi:MAG: hypothetical protein KGI60_00435 [Patescibacteria group bacterium]|nr:hypothetical protein [Patescibacteria group bacterium]